MRLIEKLAAALRGLFRPYAAGAALAARHAERAMAPDVVELAGIMRSAWPDLRRQTGPLVAEGDDDDADDDDDESGDVAVKKRKKKEMQDKVDGLRKGLIEKLAEFSQGDAPSGEDKEEVKRREKELGDIVDGILEIQAGQESDELKELKDRLAKLERDPIAGPHGVETQKAEREMLRRKRYDGGSENWFADRRLAAKDTDPEIAKATSEYEKQFNGPDRLKAWATGDLEDVDLITPDVQPALPYLAAAAKVVGLFREIRTTSPSIEFPVFTTGLDVDVVPVGVTKPHSDPTWELRTARVYTIAGTTEVPNQLLEDYAAARGWISSELGRATGVKEDRLVLEGTGTGEPTGILNHGEITARAATDVNGDGAITGRDVIEAVFRAMQDVRVDGLTEPSDIVLSPLVWTDIVLSFESNIGYLYGPPQGSGFPEGEPVPRLLGLPVTQDAYVTSTYGATSNVSPVIVGNFDDGIVLRRSPFRIDVDTSLGFLENTTWFRGEERMGFIVIRPASFKVVTNIVPTA